MPDALSKTIPIWCAVLNYISLGSIEVYTPPNAVFASEHDQISKKIAGWAELAIENGIDVDSLKHKINKPLRPIWVTPDGYLPDEIPQYDEFYPLVLCTASRMVQDGSEHRQGYTYVQGAADDHEEWAKLLNAELLWNHRDLLGDLKYSDDQLYELIEDLAKNGGGGGGDAEVSVCKISPMNIFIASGGNIDSEFSALQLFGTYDGVIDVCEKPFISAETKFKYLSCPLPSGKKGSKELRVILPRIANFLEKGSLFKKNILVVCDTGSDFSVGIALVVSCLFYSSSYTPLESKTTSFLDKTEIRKRLVHIITQHKSNPSRNTLTSVNSYLMS